MTEVTESAPVEIGAMADASAERALAWALERFRGRIVLCTSFQMEGLVALDLAVRLDPRVRVITIDTGRLHEETYTMMETVRRRYGVAVEVLMPDPFDVKAMTLAWGVNLFYQSVEHRRRCCHVRKVEPLRTALRGVDAWITGLRRNAMPTRAAIRTVEIDTEHGGIVKLNPLADWTDAEVLAYVREHDVPRHPLYARGYRSIGCAPCTRAVVAGEDERAGRWWWEHGAPKECGIHVSPDRGVRREPAR